MGQKWDHIPASARRMIERQQLFFVATAPLGADGHVNMSPKGHRSQTFAVLGDNQVAYLDMTGSGIETLAHVKENGRITFMFCNFDGAPGIIRLYARATAHERGTPDFDDLLARAFPQAAAAEADGAAAAAAPPAECGDGAAAAPAVWPASHPGFSVGARSVILCDVYEVASACGYAVPLYDFRGERDVLVSWCAKKGPEGIGQYQRTSNGASKDGLRGLEAAAAAGDAGGGEGAR